MAAIDMTTERGLRKRLKIKPETKREMEHKSALSGEIIPSGKTRCGRLILSISKSR
jgi:hypothetical protein